MNIIIIYLKFLLNQKYNLIKVIATLQTKRTNQSHRMYPKIRQYKLHI